MPAVDLLDASQAPSFAAPSAGGRPERQSGEETPDFRFGRRLEVPPYDLAAALELERTLGLSHVMAQILVRRGFTEPEAVRDLLSTSERHDAGGFSRIEETVALIRRHIGDRSRIVVHGDYDVDGVCATAVLVRALRSLGADPQWYLPSRSEDGYGLAAATVERLAGRGTELLITVDCGITAVDEVGAAQAAGIDVIVTDHHAPRADGALPGSLIVHPALGPHPSQDLCGTAVAHKLAEALGASSAEEDLELVALATVADLMPLRGENRRIVRDGLAQMAASRRPGIRALMAVSRTDPSALDASSLGFRLAPRINAAGRLRRADAGLELLLTEDPDRAREIAAELDRVNSERRAVEQRIGWEAEAMAAGLGERSAYVLASEGWHPGVIGIVASRIVERYHRPAILIALDGADPAAPAQGSGRSIPGFDLLGALDVVGEHLVRHGGHRAAAGLTILPERIDEFRSALESHADRMLGPELLEPVETVDAVVSAADLSLGLAEELLALEPCGMGNPGVRLLVPGARFEAVRPIADGRHARFTVNSGGASAAAVAWGCDGAVPGADREAVDASFRLERNVWNGVVEPRLVLRHVRPCGARAISVIGEPTDYLEAVFAEVDRELEPDPTGTAAGQAPAAIGTRTVLDRRGASPLTVIADACAAAAGGGGEALAVCADVPRRLTGLAERLGGFTLVSYAALLADTEIMGRFAHVVALDPPASGPAESVLLAQPGYTHLAWGEPELRFAVQMHELEYGLRTSLVALYRSLADRQRAVGEELERLLRGPGRHGRSARLAGRLVRVFAELGLVSLDRDLRAVALVDSGRTELERSTAFRAYEKINEEGQRFLRQATPVPRS